MAIRVVNLKKYQLNGNEELVIVDRRTPLGNPFIMKDEKERDEVCDKYQKWFHEQMFKQDSPVLKEVMRIIELSKTKDIALGCWCYPKRCHATTIKAFIHSMEIEGCLKS